MQQAALSEALPVVEAVLVFPEVHEPLLVVVALPLVARLTARWANSTLENSITVENETIVFFTSSILDLQRSLLGGELWNRGSAEMAAISKKTAARTRIAPGVYLLAADEKRIQIASVGYSVACRQTRVSKVSVPRK
jgi:hypothetical protein